MKYYAGSRATLTFIHCLSALSCLIIGLGSLHRPHVRATCVPKFLRNADSATASIDYRLDAPPAQTVPRSEDIFSWKTKSAPRRGSLAGKLLRCFGRRDFSAAVQGKEGGIVPKIFALQEMRKVLIVEHPTATLGKYQLGPESLEKLRQWKSIPQVTNFLERIELRITQIVDAINYLEIRHVAPEDLNVLFTRFTEKRTSIQPAEKFRNLVHSFITDVFMIRVGSNQPKHMLNVYLKHEYEIYKNYAPERIFVLAHAEIQRYIDILIFGASRYFKESRNNVDVWQEEVHSIIEMLHFFHKRANPFYQKEAETGLLRRQLSQISARSGDPALFQHLDQASVQMEVPVHKIQSFLLLSTKGPDPAKRENLFIHTQRIYDDLLEVCDLTQVPSQIKHRNAVQLPWDEVS